MKLKTLSDFFSKNDVKGCSPSLGSAAYHPLEGRRVLVRVDYNVPRQGGRILDCARLDATLPTLFALLERGAKVILITHFGRPKGQPNPEMSLEFLVPLLSKKLNQHVFFAQENDWTVLEGKGRSLPEGSVMLVENIRFHREEEANDQDFAASLATLGDMYVNDAFSVSHRAHASVAALPGLLPSYAGLLFEKEFSLVQKAVEAPQKPLLAIVAGSKISTKLTLIESLIEKTDGLVLGGGIANTFLAASGFDMGRSLVERSMISTAQGLLKKASLKGCELILPSDLVSATDLQGSNCQTTSVQELPSEAMALDIGPQTVTSICNALERVKTVLWNGPLGVFETPPFDQGTLKVAQYVGRLTREGILTSIAGGGETAAVMKQAGVDKDLSGLSLSGGAFLEALEGQTLPGVGALAS